MPFASIPDTPFTAKTLLRSIDAVLRRAKLDRIALACTPALAAAATVAMQLIHGQRMREMFAEADAPALFTLIIYLSGVQLLLVGSIGGSVIRAWVAPKLVAAHCGKPSLSLPTNVCVKRGLAAWGARALCGLPLLVPIALLAMCASGPLDAVEPILDEGLLRLAVAAASAMIVAWLVILGPVYLVIPSIASLEHGSSRELIRRSLRLVRGCRPAAAGALGLLVGAKLAALATITWQLNLGITGLAIALALTIAVCGCTAAIAGPSLYATLREH